jgi:succinate-semialdehyde dehydrogenase/glutarate-semialdehyde dehydrogenase
MGYATTNPFTGETTKEYPSLTDRQAGDAVTAAEGAFHTWRELPVEQRAETVRRAGELMLERKAEIAELMTLEMGKLIGESEDEVDLAASILEYYGTRGPALIADQPLQVDEGEAVLVTRPLGVLLGVMPWNFPLYQVVRFAAPNLVVGNTILLKHASINPQCALFLQRLFIDAGVPPGGYVNLFVSTDQITTIIEDPRVQGASLTGSEGAGQRVGEVAGKNLKKVVLELGGSDPFIVLDDHDLENTIKSAVNARVANTGQSCTAGKRFIVVDDVYDQFVEEFGKQMAALQPGDPGDPDTTLGPMSSQSAVDDLAEQVQDAIDKGAEVVTGGQPIDRDGAFFAPTVLTGVTPDMRAYEEELFGPAAVVYKVGSDDEAINLANSSPFGLGSAVFSSDLKRAHRVAEHLDNGMVWINHPTATAADLPFGGVKRSGVGRELSHLGIQEFVNKKLIRTLKSGTKAGTVAG